MNVVMKIARAALEKLAGSQRHYLDARDEQLRDLRAMLEDQEAELEADRLWAEHHAQRSDGTT